MAKNWSEAARSALDAYPWTTESDKDRACMEAELVAFGEQVEVDDLPLPVRRWLKAASADTAPGWTWRGQSWDELTSGFERMVLEQVLKLHGGNIAATARALATTPRVVAYKAAKYRLATRTRKQLNTNN